MEVADTRERPYAQAEGRWVLVATILASSMAFIDGTALNVALPVIQASLDATGTQLLWIVNAYLLLLASLLLVGGALGDRLGRRRVFATGIALFALGSLACGLAPSAGFLIGARAVQGVGGALMVPGSLSIITATFPADERGRAIGTWSAFTTIATLVAPALGGALADAGFWRGVFFLNLPLAAAALFLTLRRVPETRDQTRHGPLDIAGAAFIVAGLALLTYGLITAGERGVQAALRDPLVIITLGAGAIAIVASVLIETRCPEPLMPPHLFKSRTFTGANLLTFFLYAALNGLTVFLPLNLVQVQGYRATLAGLAFLPFSIILAAVSRWAGGLVDRFGPRLPLTVGPLIAAVGFVLYGLPGRTGGPADYWTTFFPATLMFGLGMGVTVAPLTATVMGAHGERYAGVASGVNNAIARTAAVLAIAVFGALMLIRFDAGLEARVQPLELPAEAEQALMEQAANLGNTSPPASLSQPAAEQVAVAIDEAFVAAFRTIAFICAGLAALSAMLAFVLVESKLPAE